MNYLAHAYRFLDDPYFVAGTALPDWMNVVDRKNRARRQYAMPAFRDPDPRVARVAQGVVQHHDDDHWFHQSASFVELSTAFAVELRSYLQAGLGHQAGFVGHISVELLLDAALIERDPQLLDRYYAALSALDVATVVQAANRICPRPATGIMDLLPRFIEVRFLADYGSNTTLLRSLNRVMRRVNLPPLPESLLSWSDSARNRVRSAADALLAPQALAPET